MHAITSVIVPRVIYKQENTVEIVVEKIGLILIGLLFNIMIATSLLHISELHFKLKGKNK